MSATSRARNEPKTQRHAARRKRRETVVVIGNGVVGFQLCRLLTREEGTPLRVVVFGEEPEPAYDRLKLTALFRNPVAGLELASRSWYEERGIELITGDPVVEVERRRQLVRSLSGESIRYDRLVFASGASPVRPAIEGADAPGVFTLRTEADARKLYWHAARPGSRVIILGGGLLGIETAAALQRLGVSVHLLEAAPQLLPKHLDAACARALAEALEARGMSVHLGVAAERIRETTSRQLRLSLGSRSSAIADAVIVAVGVKPRDELARAAGLDVDRRGGIVVDDRMRSSDERIYAIGDCARHRGVSYGLAGPGYEMARVAAGALVGGRPKFKPVSPGYRLKVPGIDVAVLGEGASRGPVASHKGRGSVCTLAVERGRVVGACTVGEAFDLPALEETIARKARVPPRALERFRRCGELSVSGGERSAAPPDAAIVCRCAGVSRGALARVASEGCSAEEASARTGAGALCGSCQPLIAEICGGRSDRARGGRGLASPKLGLLSLAVAALAACAAIVVAPPALASAAREAAALALASGATRRVSGFVLLGLCAFALALPILKRGFGARGKRLARHRALHAGIGLSATLAVVLHTGMRLGDNLNHVLMMSFLALLGTGAVLGGFTAVPSGRAFAASVRSAVAIGHALILWVLPVLLGFHIFTAFYF